jgi:putative tryptophan/tyrosine transport system substrate-binding protein
MPYRGVLSFLSEAREVLAVKRREFIAMLGGAAAAWPLVARAQGQGRIPTIGVLWHAANAEEEGALFTGLVEGFRKLGYVEGRNITLEHRFPNEMPERFKSMAAELVSLNVDALVCAGIQAALALQEATKTIPIIFMFMPDPVGSKLVDSLARPGGNATGVTNFGPELIGKRLQLLNEIIPGLSRVALLINSQSQISRLYIDFTQTAAAARGLVSQTFEVRSLDDLEPALNAMATTGMQAVTINPDGLIYQGKAIIAKMAIARRMALAAYSRETFDAGALMSYGPDNIVACQRAAVLVDKILKGSRPNELPVEQPTKFQYFVNLKTAKALGIDVPLHLQQLADEVIE